MHLTQRYPSTKITTKTSIKSTKMADFTPFPNDYLPPKGFFESYKALFESINTYAKLRSYAFTTSKSIIKKSKRTTVTYVCNRSRRQLNDDRVR